jgi:3'-phosphoadenosine 5'-phosphosulfate sulfotransferase (PAPS reductase)/FAD synthetase
MAKTAIDLDYADLDRYLRIIIGFSGGKDSIACVLSILEKRPDLKDRIELWHHDIDGVDHNRPTPEKGLFDWSITASYCKAFAKALGLKIRFQWRDGGFENEMLREVSSTAGVYYETDEGVKYSKPRRPIRRCGKKVIKAAGLGYIIRGACGYEFGGEVRWLDERRQWTADETVCPRCGKERKGATTRRKLPQVSADLQTRWCSGYLKIDVARMVIGKMFKGTEENPAHVLLVTGERAQESGARAEYNEAEIVGVTKQRVVHQWRPVHKWNEAQVWEIMKRHKINAHPCYHLGWGRASCLGCIFGNSDQWASARAINATQIDKIVSYEAEFGYTLKRDEDLTSVIAKGSVYEQISTMPEQVALARGTEYPEDQIIVKGEWQLPAGAYRECGGPI